MKLHIVLNPAWVHSKENISFGHDRVNSLTYSQSCDKYIVLGTHCNVICSCHFDTQNILLLVIVVYI